MFYPSPVGARAPSGNEFHILFAELDMRCQTKPECKSFYIKILTIFQASVAVLLFGGMNLTARQATATIIASYDFTTNSNSSDTEPNSTASVFNGFGGSVRSGSSLTFVQTYANLTSTSAAEAITNTDYFTFNVIAAPGAKLNLTTLDFTTQVEVPTSGIVSGGTFFVRTSADNYAADVASYTMGDEQTIASRSVVLSGLSFQNVTTVLEFRIYIYKSVSSVTTFDGLRVDNVVLNGSVAVPEPATGSLLSLAGVPMLMRRRKRIA